FRDFRYELIGGDTDSFTINQLTGEITTLANLDYETRSNYSIQARVWDGGSLGAGLYGAATINIDVTDVNEAPTNLVFSNTTTSIAENTPTPTRTKVADLSVEDDALGTNVYGLTGPDASAFEIADSALYLKAGVVLNFEAQQSYTVAVTVDDPTLGTGPELTRSFTLNVTDVNEAPTSLSLTPLVADVSERDRPDPNGPTPPAIKLGVLSASDPDLPTSGDFAQLAYSVSDPRFEILNGNELWLKTGAMSSIDYEAGTTLSVDVTVKDRNGAPEGLALTRTFTFAVSDQTDVLEGGPGADVLVGQQGRDILRGMGGDDTLQGADGNDDLLGGSGNDTLYGDAGNDYLQADDGNDQLFGGDGADTLLGGDGNDMLYGGAGNDMLDGGAGDDVLDGGPGADIIQGGTGTDTLSYAGSTAGVNVNLATGLGTGGDAEGDTISGIERLIGSSYADTLTGTAAAEYIDGGAGNDIISGGGGADELHGGDGDDTITGGNDGGWLYGEAGNDILIGGEGVDHLYGGAGNDILRAMGAGDELVGGAGDDILEGGEGSDSYVLDTTSGHDTIRDFDAEGDDHDQINYNGVDTSWLWFERIGNDLKITIVGSSSTATVEGWYADDPPPANRRVEMVLTSTHYSIDVDGLTALMATKAKPADLAALGALMTDSTYASQWAAFWGINQAPVLGAISAQSTPEDNSLAIAITATDDFTSKDLLHYELRTYSDAGLTQENTATAVQSWNVALNGSSQVLNIAPSANYGGTVYAQLKVFDLTGRMDQKVFTLTVTPVADMPSLTTPAALSGTLDGGSLPLSISADLLDTDGSESLQIWVLGLPGGLSLNKGTNLGGGTWSLTKADLQGLAITGPANWATDFTLTVRAISTEAINGSTATTPDHSINVTINARPSGISGSLSVNENAANGTVVGMLTGQDPDGDTLTYSLTDTAGGRFAINSVTGAVTVANGSLLDYESASSAAITARVTDTSGLTKDVPFTVSIIDVNEAPSLSGGTFSIAENLAAGTGVTTLTASDPDATAAYRDFRYELIGGDTGAFAINQTTGAITTLASFNYEARQSYSVQARVWDAGAIGSGNSAVATVNINVTDVNEAPSLSNQTLSVQEYPVSNPTQTTINLVNPATDPDTLTPGYRNLYYRAIGGDTNVFSMAPNGVITVQQTLDYETRTSYSLQVQVWDGGAYGVGLSSTATVNINVTNVNEAPYIIGVGTSIEYEEWTPENAYIA
ncbi:MAG TPA: cadherin domain-containing protein, partial [Rhizomicrobium sp.]